MSESENQDNRFPYPEIKEWLLYLAREKTSSPSTIASYGGDVIAIMGYVRADFAVEKLTDVQAAHLLSAYDIARTTRKSPWSRSTCQGAVIILRTFFHWCKRNQKISDDFAFPPLDAFALPKKVFSQPIVVKPETLFGMRQLTGVRLDMACCVEMAISSGMRSPSELFSLRANQIQFDKHPFDISTGKPSVYTGGMIALNPVSQQIKYSRPRIVFFSKIAGRMLRKYMQLQNIPETSNAYLFPFADLGNTLDVFIEAFPELQSKEITTALDAQENAAELEGFEQMPDSLKRRQERAMARKNRFRYGINPLENKEVRTKIKQLHWHAFRHTFTCYQFYRNYYGEQHNVERLRVMLGHHDETELLTYLTQLSLINSQREWEQIHIGRPTDWMRVNENFGKAGTPMLWSPGARKQNRLLQLVKGKTKKGRPKGSKNKNQDNLDNMP